jgi:hypothetical protein
MTNFPFEIERGHKARAYIGLIQIEQQSLSLT